MDPDKTGSQHGVAPGKLAQEVGDQSCGAQSQGPGDAAQEVDQPPGFRGENL